jgi:hypothetical protein
MNYTRRPNRPDGNLYRDMRRQKFRKPRDISRRGRRLRGAMLPIAVLVVILLCAGIFLWVH